MAEYVIRSGDTLSALAQRYGTTVQALAQANGISDPNRIYAGATIRIPDQMQPTTGAMPRPRPQQVAQAQQAVPLPPPNPQRGPVPLPRPRPEQANSGMGSYNAPAPMNFAATANVPQPGTITPPQPGSLTTGSLTPAPQPIPAGWRPVPPPLGMPAGREWTAMGRNPGPIGAPNGDPDATAIYGQPGLTGGQRSQYAAERGMVTPAAPRAVAGDGNVPRQQAGPNFAAGPAQIPQPAPRPGGYEAALQAAILEQQQNEMMMEARRQAFLADAAAYRAGLAADEMGGPAAGPVAPPTLNHLGQLMTGGPPPTDPRNPSLGWLLNMARQPNMQRLGNLAPGD